MSRIKRKHGGDIQSGVAVQSRKERRKEARSLKKQIKVDKHRRKFKNTQQEEEEEDTKESPPPPPMAKPVKEQQNKAKKREDRNRKRRLAEDNAEEEANIKALSKKLGLNKRKSKKPLPKSFLDDGLDFLLDAVDAGKLQDGLISDDEVKNVADEESHSDFEESDEEDNSDVEDMEEDVGLSESEECNEDDGVEGEEIDEGLDDENEEDSDNENVEDLDDENDEDLDDENDEDLDDENDEDLDDENDEDLDDENEEDDGIDDDMDTEESSSHEEEEPSDKKKPKGDWEDIYGRKRDAQGNVLSTQSYVPPALRHSRGDEGTKTRLKRKMKGLLNRLAESNMHSISMEIESLFAANSRRDTNAALSELLTDACVSPVLTPERLAMEHVLLISILNANVGNEVGAHFLHHLVSTFNDLYEKSDLNGESKELDCLLLLIVHLYAFKVVDAPLIFDILAKLTKSFQIKDVELILLVLKTVGFNLRKDDAASLKANILDIQSASGSSTIVDSRTKFMIEILMAIKNNNVKKIPNYDPELQPHYRKIMKNFLRPGAGTPPLSVRLEDLLNADSKGRWWIVGSAWSGHAAKDESTAKPVSKEKQFSSDLLDLARKMRMNTSARKNIFCTVMSSQDYMDAFEKLLKLKNVPNKEREVTFVLQDCCLQEKTFNPFYFQVIAKLSAADRKYRMAAQFSLWDKIKEIEALKSPSQKANLAEYTSSLILKFSLPLSVLKVITFADINKPTITFLKAVLFKVLTAPEDVFKKVLSSVVGHAQLKGFRESITIFMKHFMGKKEDLRDRIALSEVLLSSRDSRTYF